jgi:hypothetical protein
MAYLSSAQGSQDSSEGLTSSMLIYITARDDVYDSRILVCVSCERASERDGAKVLVNQLADLDAQHMKIYCSVYIVYTRGGSRAWIGDSNNRTPYIHTDTLVAKFVVPEQSSQCVCPSRRQKVKKRA